MFVRCIIFWGDLGTIWWIRRFASASAFIIYPRRRFAWGLSLLDAYMLEVW